MKKIYSAVRGRRSAGLDRDSRRPPTADRRLSSRPAMAKKVLTLIKLRVPGGAANPAPPVGPALGQHGVNIMEFCKAFNAQTQDQNGRIIPVEITVFEDRSFTFITKTPPAAVLIKEAAGIQKGSAEPNREKVAKITKDQVRQIAETKLQDLNARDIDQAAKIIEGTARSMGVEVGWWTAGRIEACTDRSAIAHSPLGAADMGESALLEKCGARIDEIGRSKPAAANSRYLRTVTRCTTRGRGVRVDPIGTRNLVE